MTKNQPFLSGFPTTFCGKIKRAAQDLIAQKRRRLAASSLSGYALQFSHILPCEFLQQLSSSKREGAYSNTNVFWIWIAQILQGNASLTTGVSLAQSWCADAGLPSPSADTGALSNGRKRLHSSYLEKVAERLNDHLKRHIREENTYRGHVVKSVDGSSLELDDTEENQADYPQPTTQKAGCGFPVMGIMGVLNHSHGGWEDFAEGPHIAHDAPVIQKLMHCFEKGDIMCADRALCSYEIRATLRQRGVDTLIRMHQARHRALDWRKGTRVGNHQRIVEWKKPIKQPATSQLTAEEWDALPATIAIRLIRFYYEDRDGKKRRMVLATTLLDSEAYDWMELAALYCQRWDIELRLRDLKTTMNLERLRVRTPETARKMLKLSLIAYNLVKATCQEAGHSVGNDPRGISFKGALETIISNSARYLRRQKHPQIMKKIWSSIIAMVAEKTVNLRPFRHEPRAQKKRPKSYSYLTKPRSEYKEIPHRGKSRSLA